MTNCMLDNCKYYLCMLGMYSGKLHIDYRQEQGQHFYRMYSTRRYQEENHFGIDYTLRCYLLLYIEYSLLGNYHNY